MSDHLGAAPRVRDRRAVERDTGLDNDLPDPRHLDTEAMRAQIGAVWCRTCKQDCLPLSNGTCGWCGNQPEKKPTLPAELATHSHRLCRHCKRLFQLPATGPGRLKRYCTDACRNRAARARNPKVRSAA